MTPEDLARRRPLWSAMSDLFLDAETRWDVPLVARCCAESGFDDGTLESIFWLEVFPEAIPNMSSIAGEWATLDLDEAALIRRAAAGRMPWLRRRLQGWMVESEWRGTCAVTQWLRPLNDSQRMQLAKALHLCGRCYFDAPGESLSSISQEEINAVDEVVAEAWQRYEPICRSMLLKDEASTHEARAAAVRRLCTNPPRR